jgi:ribosomal-protein-serine acetyltransferase
MATVTGVMGSRIQLPERIAGADGLLLRQWRTHDAETLGRAVAESADHLRPWMAWIAEGPMPLERRRARIEEWERDWSSGGDVVLGVFLDAALELPGVTHVEIHHDKANQASAGIPRKLGFQWVGESSDEPEAPADIGIEWRWQMDRATWAARPSTHRIALAAVTERGASPRARP